MRRPASALLAAAVLAGLVSVVAPAVPAVAADYARDEAYDLDCDGRRDVVNGFGYVEVNGKTNAGRVSVYYMGTGRLVHYTQDTSGIYDPAEYNDLFGDAYTSVDWTGDGCDDLIVSAPGESIGSAGGTGMLWVIPGAPGGLDTAKSFAIHQNSPGVPGGNEDDDEFGFALAAAVTRDGEPYVLVTARLQDVGGADDGGAVWYWRGGSWDYISQSSAGVPGAAGFGGYFGEGLSASDRYFAVGAPGDDGGTVTVFSNTFTDGRPTPLAAFGQDSPGISGGAEDIDQFGHQLSVISYRPSASAPIGALVAIGAPYEHLGDADTWYEGMAHLVLVATNGKYTEITAVHENTAGVTGVVEPNDTFGGDVTLAIMGNGLFGTPSTTRWVATAAGGAHVFKPTSTPGDGDVWITTGTYGLPYYVYADFVYGASQKYLYVERYSGTPEYGIPWSNILNGESVPAQPMAQTNWE